MCLNIVFEKLGIGSFFYAMYYLTKHSSFKQKIQNDFGKYVKELFKTEGQYLQVEVNEMIDNTFAEKFTIEIPSNFGVMCYYGVSDIIKSDKDKAFIYIKKAYKLAKEKKYNRFMRNNYLYIYKCRKQLFKNNKIYLRKLNKTRE